MLNTFQYPFRSLMGVIAVLLSIVATVLLMYRGAVQGNAWHVAAFGIYGLSLITLWTMSTIYHSLKFSKAVNRTMEQIDHAMIYFLIAGTYTPICLVVLRGGWGWSLLCITWTFAITGIVLKLVFRHPAKWLRILFFLFYLFMGWLIVIAWVPLSHAMPSGGIHWLVAGGIFYTIGAGIFNLRHHKIHPNFNAHDIWHVFVLAGSFCHWWMMFNYVVYLK